MAAFASVLSSLSAVVGLLFFLRVKSHRTLILWIPKVFAGSVASFAALIGTVGAVLAWLSKARLAVAASLLGMTLSLRYVLRAAARHDGFGRAFGPNWESRIAPEKRARMLPRRWVFRVASHPGVRFHPDLSFWTIPDTRRELLCDLWQPPSHVRPSGRALIYLHGGAWYWMDRDFGTRPFFRYLAARGHLVMDVAYRLCPETDLFRMVGDAKRAVVWIKVNARRYSVDPAFIVLAGSSSGGHLALLVAYAHDYPRMTPDDVSQSDTSVRAVVACYPCTDLTGFYRHFEATYGSLVGGFQPGEGRIIFRAIGAMARRAMGTSRRSADEPRFSVDWMMSNLVGGSPVEVPEAYDLASPIDHAGSDSPPTLLLQGEHLSFQPARLSRALHRRLATAGVPSVYIEFPQTEHAFDLSLSRYAPASQAALYHVERFLALMCPGITL